MHLSWLTVEQWNTAKESSLGCAIIRSISNGVVVCHRTFEKLATIEILDMVEHTLAFDEVPKDDGF